MPCELCITIDLEYVTRIGNETHSLHTEWDSHSTLPGYAVCKWIFSLQLPQRRQDDNKGMKSATGDTHLTKAYKKRACCMHVHKGYVCMCHSEFVFGKLFGMSHTRGQVK